MNARNKQLDDDTSRRPGVRMGDLNFSISLVDLRMDAESRDTMGRYVRDLTVKVWHENDGDKETVLGSLDCILLDAVGADADGESLFPEVDYEGRSFVFYEFLFVPRVDFVKGRLLHHLRPDEYEYDDEEEDGELCNVLCVQGGWWACRPEVLLHLIAKLQRTLKFDLVCIDADNIRTRVCKGRSWWMMRPPKTPLEFPLPFKKVVWGDITDPAHLVDDAKHRAFWVAPLFESVHDSTLPALDDDEPVQLTVLR